MTRRVTITALCEAIVEERWRFDVPDDWSDEQIGDVVKEFGVDGFTGSEDVKFIDVQNVSTANERDRDCVCFEVDD